MTNTNREKGWPVDLSGLFSSPPFAVSIPVSVTGISVFALLACIGLLALGWLLIDLLSGDQRRAAEATKAALPILAGVVGLPLIVWRLLILDRQTKISEAKTQIDRETHYTSIFSRSIEQLGQTREIKKAIQTSDGLSDTTVTVPNIEVRLGGIHSLARLAEESVRDRETIQNVLLSYVRENSWLDRNGSQSTPLPEIENSAYQWASAYREGNVTTEAKTALKDWEREQAEQQTHARAWGMSLKETRVDVNEAIDAIPRAIEAPKGQQLRFYECLFVGSKLETSALEICHFDRCTLVQCKFERSSKYKFTNCTLIDCTFGDVRSANVSFTRSRLHAVTIGKSASASIDIRASTATNLRISDISEATVRIMFSSLHRPHLLGAATKAITLYLYYASLAGGRFGNLILTAASDMSDCAMANTRMESIDFSAVTLISKNALATTKANPVSKQPSSWERPSQWPEFDPDYVDEDDIPF
ncbi:pentapeptide repeat-containing protein [Bradyrhizobium diazoefficiens]|nr:pentapeptide repeat-containing protein [Bradyrhizobium diazoefficiens]MBR0775468.1 pentapeptide repeat-containing protein [Bradyrhizobium diazoefficiens]